MDERKDEAAVSAAPVSLRKLRAAGYYQPSCDRDLHVATLGIVSFELYSEFESNGSLTCSRERLSSPRVCDKEIERAH